MGKAVRARLPRKARFVLGADTVVWCHQKVLGKPRNLRGALSMLTLLSGRVHEVYTALALRDRKRGEWVLGYAKTRVHMKSFNADQIKKYFSRVNPLDKAGAYAIQEGPRIVKRIEGSRSNVIGLPLALLKKILRAIPDFFYRE